MKEVARISLSMMRAAMETKGDQVLLVPARQAAEMCGTSERTWRTWDAGGLVPCPVTIGRAKFWRTAELRAWVAHGCPPKPRGTSDEAEKADRGGAGQ